MTGLSGADLLCAAVNQVIAHPETWDQGYRHSTRHSIIGHCELLAGVETDEPSSIIRAKLGISVLDYAWLCGAERTLLEIYQFALALQPGYDRQGYDRQGYDRQGYYAVMVPFALRTAVQP